MIECAVRRDPYFDPIIILSLAEPGHENKMTQANPVCIHLAPKYVFDAKGACSFSLEGDAPGQNLPKKTTAENAIQASPSLRS
jgi:hypothetical protein